MDLINVEGWIPREQILGLEARSKVRKECQNGQCRVKLNLMKLNTLILLMETKAILPKSDFLMQIEKQSVLQQVLDSVSFPLLFSIVHKLKPM
jgi:hypothetical protein